MNPIIQGILSGFVLALYVGPVFFYLINSSLQRGVKKTLVIDLGVLFADAIWIILISFSFFNLDSMLNYKFTGLLGGIVFVVIGFLSIFYNRKRTDVSDNTSKKRNLFLIGFVLNFSNPGVPVFWIGTYSLANKFTLYSDKVFYYLAILLTVFITDFTKIYLASRIKKSINIDKISLLKKLIGLVLIGFGVYLIYSYSFK